MLATTRPGGFVNGASCVQLLPSQLQVSINVVDVLLPLKRTTLPLTASKAITAPIRAGGLAAGDFLVHALPSNTQVSFT
jgi:hypothetical protein